MLSAKFNLAYRGATIISDQLMKTHSGLQAGKVDPHTNLRLSNFILQMAAL